MIFLPSYFRLSIRYTALPPHYFLATTSFNLQMVFNKGPSWALLFFLTIHNLTTKLKSELRSFYLDNGTLGDSVEEMVADIHFVKNLASEVDLDLNLSKLRSSVMISIPLEKHLVPFLGYVWLIPWLLHFLNVQLMVWKVGGNYQ